MSSKFLLYKLLWFDMADRDIEIQRSDVEMIMEIVQYYRHILSLRLTKFRSAQS